VKIPDIAGLALITFSTITLIGLSLLKDKVKGSFRNIPTFDKFNKALGTAVENGSRIHFSLGSAGTASPRSAASFAALNILQKATESAALSDKSPLATSGEAVLSLLAQDSMRSSYHNAGAEQDFKASSSINLFINFSFS